MCIRLTQDLIISLLLQDKSMCQLKFILLDLMC